MYRSMYLSMYLSIYLSIYLSVCLSPNLQKWREHVVFCAFSLRNVLRATTACTFSTSEPPKVARTCGALYILTWKCASRHNSVHFFDIWTSKSGPRMVCFVHFDLEMCFAPQRRALFRHLNCQVWSENGVFCTFWLGNVLRATTACTFSTSQLPKVVRSWGVLYILTCKCASRHNGVQFFISHLASWLRTRRFSEPTFRPSGAPNHWKNTVNRDFPTFSRICIFFLLTLSLLLFFLLIFLSSNSFSSTLLSSNLSLLSASSLLCFSSIHIVGSLTSKLPSIMYYLQFLGDCTLQSDWNYFFVEEVTRGGSGERLTSRGPFGWQWHFLEQFDGPYAMKGLYNVVQSIPKLNCDRFQHWTIVNWWHLETHSFASTVSWQVHSNSLLLVCGLATHAWASHLAGSKGNEWNNFYANTYIITYIYIYMYNIYTRWKMKRIVV